MRCDESRAAPLSGMHRQRTGQGGTSGDVMRHTSIPHPSSVPKNFD